MANSPPRPCTHPGCPRYATNGGRCADHQRQAWSSTTTSAHARGYGRDWRKMRRAKLNEDPVCELRIKCTGALAVEVDHDVPKARGGGDNWENLRSACRACHKAKTTREAQEAKR
jgi:5-methylcytosine-specific restriction protein A